MPYDQSQLAELIAANSDYEIKKELGRGGMGVVYLAENKLAERLEVLKVLNPSLETRLGTRERFQNEILLISRLNHPAIVIPYGLLALDEPLVLAMEYIDGYDLSRLISRRRRFETAIACDIACQIAMGIEHAHSMGLIHRDIKPSNVMTTDSDGSLRLKILDFGLAKASADAPQSGLTMVGTALGTPAYMSPEQFADASAIDGRADIYSLGATLFHMLTGRPPYSGRAVQIMQAQLENRPPSLRQFVPDAPIALDDAVARMLDTNPDDRYQHIAEVRQTLQQLIPEGHEISLEQFFPSATQSEGAPSVTATFHFESAKSDSRGARRLVGRRSLLAGGVILAGAAIGVVGWSYRERRTARPHSDDASNLTSNLQTREPTEKLQADGLQSFRQGDYSRAANLLAASLDQRPLTTASSLEEFEVLARLVQSLYWTGEVTIASQQFQRMIEQIKASEKAFDRMVQRLAFEVAYALEQTQPFAAVPPSSIFPGWSSSWAPDRRQILSRIPPGSGEGPLVWTSPLSGRQSLCSQEGIDVACHPTNPRLVAYSRQGQVYIYEEEMNEERLIGTGRMPSWNMSGETIYFHDPEARSIQSFRESGSAATAPPIACEYLYPGVSPDGTKVAIKWRDRLRVVRSDTQEVLFEQTLFGWGGLRVGWSPDGRFLGFGDDGYGNVGLWVLNLETGTAWIVLEGNLTLPRWSSNGAYVACDDRQKGKLELYFHDALSLPT